MDQVKLYRKRFIPNETNYLKDDEILLLSEDLIVTKWTTLKPRKDIASGISAYFLDEGFKISKVLDNEGKFVHWYCDIIDTKIDKENRTYVFEDLLLDVVIKKDGFVRVMDADELADAFKEGLISGDQLTDALHKFDNLLEIIYGGRIAAYTSKIEKFR